jgi:hypothetical protein
MEIKNQLQFRMKYETLEKLLENDLTEATKEEEKIMEALEEEFGYNQIYTMGFMRGLNYKEEEVLNMLIETRKFLNRLPSEWFPESIVARIDETLRGE